MCAAPRRERQFPASFNSILVENVYKRSHRGSRSKFALLRRSLPKRCRALPGIAHGESGARMPASSLDQPPFNSLIHSHENDLNISEQEIPIINKDDVQKTLKQSTKRPKKKNWTLKQSTKRP